MVASSTRRGALLACALLILATGGSQPPPAAGPSSVRGTVAAAIPSDAATPSAAASVAPGASASDVATATSAPSTQALPTPTATRPPATPLPTSKPRPVPTPAPTPVPTPARWPRRTPARPPPPPPTAACPLFPASNVWNRRVDTLPVAANSTTLIATIGAGTGLHPDFGSYLGYGIPYNVVGASTPRSTVSFDYADESDAGPYPVPANPKIEAGGDAHLLLWDTAACRLYELYAAQRTASGWHAGSGAIWDLRSTPCGRTSWTSADAAGLPILPGLVRYDEVAAAAILHAIRFTAPQTRSAHIYPRAITRRRAPRPACRRWACGSA